MNRNFKIALLHLSREEGFAVPIVMGLGLIMLLIVATMLMRSQEDQLIASSQKNTAQSLAISEDGITRSIAQLEQLNNGYYLKLNYDPINPATGKTYLGADGILNSGDEETTVVDQWSNPPISMPCATTGNPSSGLLSGTIKDSSGNVVGNYTILSYRYRDPDGIPNTGDERGNLLVQGTEQDGVSQVQISMPITQNQIAIPGMFPGLYASNSINLGNNDVQKISGETGSATNVICKNCQVPVDECSNTVPTQQGLNDAVGRKKNSSIDGNILIVEPELPAVPTPPANAINLGAISCDLTLPRIQDLTGHIPGQSFDYVVTSIDMNGNAKLSVDTSQGPVFLYVSGNITFSGNAAIAHSGSAANLRIYGNPADNNDNNDQAFKLNGGSQTTDIFIYAPDANVDINGGSNAPAIVGAVWAKSWDASSSNNADIQVPDNLPTLLGGNFSVAGWQVYRSSPGSSWRQTISTQ